MGNPDFVRTLINKTFAGRFFLSRLTRRPMVGKWIEHLLFEDDDIIYLPRDRTVPVHRRLDERSDMVLPSQVLEELIRRARRHWIMNFCICRESSGCRDYPADLGCLFMGEAVMGINPRWGRPASAEEALEHVRKCREAGLVHMVGRNKLDSVWLNVRPAHRLLTVCNCCPCCCLWRILPHISPRVGEKVHRMPGIEVTVTQDCIGCGTCTENVCFADAIAIEDGRAVIGERCRGCGRCVEVCPNGAIELRVIDPAFADRTLQRLLAAVNLQ